MFAGFGVTRPFIRELINKRLEGVWGVKPASLPEMPTRVGVGKGEADFKFMRGAGSNEFLLAIVMIRERGIKLGRAWLLSFRIAMVLDNCFLTVSMLGVV